MAGHDPPPLPGHGPAQGLRRTLAALLPADEVEDLLHRALAYGHWRELPDDAQELSAFVNGPLRSALMASYRLEMTERIVHALARKPSGVQRRRSSLQQRAVLGLVALLHDPGQRRDAICHLLRSGGCEVQIASKPDAGLMLLAGSPPPSLVIVGAELAGESAETVVGGLRRQFDVDLPPLLVISPDEPSWSCPGATAVVPSPRRDAVAFLSEIRRRLVEPAH